jgi:hypothetical protein
MKTERRHDLKEDVFVATVSRLWGQMKQYRRPVLLGLGAVALLILVITVAQMHFSGRVQKAWGALAAAERIDDADDLTDDEVRTLLITRLTEAGPRLEGTPAEPTYLKRLGSLLCRQQDPASLDKAVQTLSTLLERYPDVPFALIARLDRAKALYELGRFKEAAADFVAIYDKSIVGDGPRMVLGPQAKWFEARCHEALGDLDRAAKAYQLCIDQGRDSSWARLAERDLGNLRAGTPSTTLDRKTDKPADTKPPAEPRTEP